MTAKKKVLVTGATGMLGSKLVFDLIQNGFEVRALYRSKKRIDSFVRNVAYYTANALEISNKVEWFKADVLNYPAIIDAMKGIDVVFHCAAMVSFYKPDNPLLFETNIQGTANVVNACIETGVKRLCHVSSVAALGKSSNGEVITEDTPWLPDKKNSGYSISKFESEMEVWRGVNEGLEAVVVNPSIILGPGEWDTGSSAFYSKIYKGLKFYTRGKTGFVDLRDVTSAMLLLCNDENWQKAQGNRYLLNAANLTYEKAFQLIARSVKVKPPGIHAGRFLMGFAWRAASVASLLSRHKPLITRQSVQSAASVSCFDGSKISREFNFTYIPIEQTISEVGAMYLKSIYSDV